MLFRKVLDRNPTNFNTVNPFYVILIKTNYTIFDKESNMLLNNIMVNFFSSSLEAP
jgi:hypothetical protein